MNTLAKFCQAFGLHPLVGFGLFAADWMLFGGEVVSAGTGLLITVPIGIALSIPSALIQRHAYGDDWGSAIGKGMMLGVLTAIPTALPSVVSLGGGVLGVVRLLAKPASE